MSILIHILVIFFLAIGAILFFRLIIIYHKYMQSGGLENNLARRKQEWHAGAKYVISFWPIDVDDKHKENEKEKTIRLNYNKSLCFLKVWILISILIISSLGLANQIIQ